MKGRALDFIISALCLGVFSLSLFYLKDSQCYLLILLISGTFAVVFLVLGVQNKRQFSKPKTQPDRRSVSNLVLLSDENTELQAWDLYGKTALIIGRDAGENHVDVDLSGSTFASMVDMEHAVLNFSAGSWYVEDLGSKNGVSITANSDGRRYTLSPGEPCRLSRGDIIIIAMTKLVVR